MASAEFVRIDRDDVRTLVVTGDIDALAQTRFRAFLSDALVDPPIELHVDLSDIAYFEASSVDVLAHFVKVAAAADFRLRIEAGSDVRNACAGDADGDWLLSHFEPFVAPTTRTEPAFVVVRDKLSAAGPGPTPDRI